MNTYQENSIQDLINNQSEKKVLFISHQTLTDKDLYLLANVIMLNSSIERFEISNCHLEFSDAAYITLMRALKHNKTIKEFTFSGLQHGMKQNFLLKNTAENNLSKCQLVTAEMVKSNNTLQKLDLTNMSYSPIFQNALVTAANENKQSSLHDIGLGPIATGAHVGRLTRVEGSGQWVDKTHKHAFKATQPKTSQNDNRKEKTKKKKSKTSLSSLVNFFKERSPVRFKRKPKGTQEVTTLR